ncbi:hypothetical protein JTE90_009933 [Oedothorax gibbosus]|uniref:Uncharacterized protein n=1 Tax=Oedothorax gibbosus TaxID=931172 RepID=A0AAV6UUR9_9ARAC|nr:hypothetical protein JTE90_009933 [Oedothorax gibbosus]
MARKSIPGALSVVVGWGSRVIVPEKLQDAAGCSLLHAGHTVSYFVVCPNFDNCRVVYEYDGELNQDTQSGQSLYFRLVNFGSKQASIFVCRVCSYSASNAATLKRHECQTKIGCCPLKTLASPNSSYIYAMSAIWRGPRSLILPHDRHQRREQSSSMCVRMQSMPVHIHKFGNPKAACEDTYRRETFRV